MATATVSAPTIWSIDPTHSLVEFSVRHMMVATVKGRFTDVKGAIRFDPDHLDRSSVDVEIGAASITTGEAQRDGHLRSPDFLDVEFNGSGQSPFGTTVTGFTAHTSINRKDFGLNWNVALETGGWLVSDTIKISLEIEAVAS
ncbi:MAG TPA: YceI family protein [Chloroflexota bacterium]|nr:YceI family protein [Chloroflexota bacterium]